MSKNINLMDGQSSSIPGSSVGLPGSAGDLVDTVKHEPGSGNSDQMSLRPMDNREESPAEPSPHPASSVSSLGSSPPSAGLPVKLAAEKGFDGLQPGRMLGKCRIERCLGHGGMGAVYLAHHLALDVPVAVKVLTPSPGKDMDELAKRFVREARLASRIHHPNVVQMLDVRTDKETGIDYIVQEYIGGGSVSDLMKKGTIEEGQALDIVICVASALTAAAEFNIVHRDIKPENIMFTERGEVKLADLGIARECNGQDEGLTVSQAIMGTPFYIAPEQARNSRQVDARADIYSLGSTLYHMLCGQPPYAGKTDFEVLSNLNVEPVPDPLQKRPNLSPCLAALIVRMMAKDPANRPASAALLQEELVAVRRTVVGPKIPAIRQSKQLQDRLLKGWRWLAVVGMMVLVGGLWIGLAGRNHHAMVPSPNPLPSPEPKHQEAAVEVAGQDREVVLPGNGRLELLCCPAGTFTMGSPTEEFGRGNDETPHQVTLSKPFWLGKYEVTQAQWQSLMGSNPSKFKGINLPVEQVSWDDAVSFCEKLMVSEAGRIPAGYEYRLPTEAEWEYACRAGSTNPYPGTGRLEDMGWFAQSNETTTHPVGETNAWGLHDMLGNVWEWCQDWYGDYPVTAVTDPTGPATGAYGVYRGGGCFSFANSRRAAKRGGNVPGHRFHDLGFRLALAPVIAKPESKPQEVAKPGPGRDVVLAGNVKLELLNCPAGTFTMGSPIDEPNRVLDEIQHQVTLTRSFWLGKYEVTQEQWQALMGNKPSAFKGVNLPVEMLSWYDAVSFCKKLTAQEVDRIPAGYEYRLPTEAEWEYACRAGSAGAFAGTGRMEDMGWYGDNSGGKTHPVGQKQPNAWGLYDMHGNVLELCRDLDGGMSGRAVTDPAGPPRSSVVTNMHHITRGGSYNIPASGDRSAHRNWDGSNWVVNVGFRVALAPVISSESGSKPQEVEMPGWGIVLPGNVKLELQGCPAGTSLMGSLPTERWRNIDEPAHRVLLTKPFWLGKYEVTQAQWQALMGDNPSNVKGTDLPVEQVSWEDAVSFCEKLMVSEAGRIPAGYEYRLPTEAEWEYACRAESLDPYAGFSHLDDMGWWYYDNSGDARVSDSPWSEENVTKNHNRSHPVGQKLPNSWGLHDMLGNVWEWCQDWYGDYPVRVVVNPAGPATGKVRVFRGGSWKNRIEVCRVAKRGRNMPGYRAGDLGFRVALAPVFPRLESKPQEAAGLSKPKSQETALPNREVVLPGNVRLELLGSPAGTFTMGSPADELGRVLDESLRQVTLTKPFWMGKYEVTQAQWQALMGNNTLPVKGIDLPVEQVSWDDAVAFCRKLTAQETEKIPAGYEYRLPTEAEWEYVCRAGSSGAFGGTGNLDDMGWYDQNSGGCHPVGKKAPNDWGLHDMHGNVAEWCHDWSAAYPAGTVVDPAGPSGPVSDLGRTVRGGNWQKNDSGCRSASRLQLKPYSREFRVGFRVALASAISRPEPKPQEPPKQ